MAKEEDEVGIKEEEVQEVDDEERLDEDVVT